MRRFVKAVLLGLVGAILGIALDFSPPGGALEQRVGLGWLFALRGPIAPPPHAVVVGINGQTGADLGLPESPQDWPRSIHARLIDRLVELNAAVIVFDIFFARVKDSDEDRALVDAVHRAHRVVLVQKLTGRRQPLIDMSGKQKGSVWIEEVVPPFEEIAAVTRGIAPFPLPKIDAAVHEFWTFKDSLGDAPTMPAAALQLYALTREPGAAPADLPATGDASATPAQTLIDTMRALRQAFTNVPAREPGPAIPGTHPELQRSLQALYAGEPHRHLNFYGPPGTIPTIPFQAVIKGFPPELGTAAPDLSGKIVFVGFSDLYDPGHPDRFYTVFTSKDGVDLSGVEIAATALGNLVDDSALRTAEWDQAVAVFVALGLLLAVSSYLLPAALGVPVSIAIAALYAVFAQWAFARHQLWLPLANPLLVEFPLVLLAGLYGQYRWERRRSKRMSEALAYYVPENVARELTESRLDPGSANKVVYSTCFATDMAGFSTLAEKLDPKQLALVLNDYFESLAEPLKANGVDVTEFRADAIMCAWTSEKPEVLKRRQPLLAALGCVDAVRQFQQRNGLTMNLRIGLECGTVFVGHAGGGGHFVFSIVGDCANTASRVESLNKHLGTHLLATGGVVEGMNDLLLRPLGRFQFVGKTEATPIVEVLSRLKDATPDQHALCERFADALACFHGADWEIAATRFGEILADFPQDGPSRFFMARAGQYLAQSLTPEFPDVIRMDAK